ncbi:hypothetical protein ESA94_19390 [Lacibacter luteus]|uniref:Uncharacterized protein n=1 Tax=Lacibacter luteus TaxID=2508719 RepID=A0A4Q1CE11_9BACT|nr:hypothetical protein [Lacibacter luteus]RXK57692.1 hypothetical protein ESA94_19390 [Lacibacter luteus]
MQKTVSTPIKRDSEIATRVKKIAELTGFSRRYVYMVINSDRHNEDVMSLYMQLQEKENALLLEVKKLVPFN